MLNIIGFLSLCLIWGSTWLGIKIGLEGIPPFTGAGYRFIIAALFIYLLGLFKGNWRLSFGKSWAMVLWAGLFTYPLPYALVYWGSQYIESGMAAVLFAVMPFFVAILAHFYLKNDRLTFIKISGMILGFSGILIIFADNLGTRGVLGFWGMLAITASSFFSALGTTLAKKHLREVDPLRMTAVQSSLGAVVLITIGLIFERSSGIGYSAKTIGSIFYLGIIGTAIAFSLYFHLLKTMEATKLATIAFITPIVALFLGIIYHNETLEPLSITGSLVVITGVFTVIMGERVKAAWIKKES